MMWHDALKRLALRLLPDGWLQRLKKIHYARTLRTLSEREEPDLLVLRHLILPGDRVADVGANFGVYTKAFADLVGPQGRVFSIEPVPQTYELLCANVRSLRLDRVQTFNLAISGADGWVQMEIPRYPTGGENFYEARIIRDGDHPEFRTVTVPTRTLDTLLLAEQPSLDFIKCDVEGHELRCLRGASELLKRVKPGWLIEISGNPDVPGSNASEVFHLMGIRGYEAFWFDGTRLRYRQVGDRSVNYFFLTERHLARLPAALQPLPTTSGPPERAAQALPLGR